jgi:hypothetical protein
MLETLPARVVCSVKYLWVVGARLRVTLRKVRVWLVEQKEPLLGAGMWVVYVVFYTG